MLLNVTFHWDPFIWLLLGFFPATLLHELGHIAAGWAVGCRGFSIYFGNPAARFKSTFALGPIRLEVGWGLGLWLHIPKSQFETWPNSHWRSLVWTLGGPLASALMLLMFWPDAGRTFVWWPGPGMTWQAHAQWWGLSLAMVPLMPLRYRSGFPSDGLRVIRTVRALIKRKRLAA